MNILRYRQTSTTLLLALLLIATGLSFASGCATTTQRQASALLEPGIYELSTGTRLQPEELYTRLANYRFVIVGETHNDPWHHEVQTLIYQGLTARRKAPVALGMEMFQRPFQEHLNAYILGDINQEQMLERTEYMKRWRFEPSMYAPLWSHAKANGAPIVALNARRELTKRMAKVGIAGLDAEEQKLLPKMDMNSPKYRAWVKQVFASHGATMDDASFDRFFQAQVLWDETMAQTAWEFMSTRNKNEAMLILAGSGHVQQSFGIPQRLQRRAGHGEQVLVTLIPESHKAHGAGITHNMLATWQEQGHADYVWVGALPD